MSVVAEPWGVKGVANNASRPDYQKSREPRAKSRRPTTDDQRPTTNDQRPTTLPPQTIMRSGPATRTAFTSVNLAFAVSALSAGFAFTLCSASVRPASAANDAFAHKVHGIAIVLSGVQSRHARPFLRRPQRPGCPQRLHVTGNRSAIY